MVTDWRDTPKFRLFITIVLICSSITGCAPPAQTISATASQVIVPTMTAQPTRIPLPVRSPSPVVSIAVSGFDTLALLESGEVWILGMPGPHQVENLSNIMGLATGGQYHRLVVKSDGTVWAWGNNKYGQLGDGTIRDREMPDRVGGLTAVIMVAAGSNHSLALTDDGTVWAWGDNSYGQLGDGTHNERLTATRVTGLDGVHKIFGCGLGSVALKEDGTVWAWGANDMKILGEAMSNELYSAAPIQVIGIDNVTDIACGNHVMALRSDGTIWAWGGNDAQQLGLDSEGDPVSVPHQIGGLPEIVDIAATVRASYALDSNGAVWAWGSNVYFELGYGTPGAVESIPTEMTGVTDVVAISGDAEHGAFLKGDGTVSVWGFDLLAANEVGDVLNQTSPTYIFGP